ncbi:MAG: BLUF domain-containing protein [Acidiferrobacterales bacterium]|nr:BLUF domain-containing protein [Acidiferrobacterales bacterium]
MRLYIYISEAVKLSDLNQILETSTSSNAAHGISGILSYNHGHYFQVIEGEDAEVSKLIKNVQKDPRHQNVTEILDIEIEGRFFANWTMNLVPLLKRNESFIRLVDFVNRNSHLLSKTQNRLFNIFYKLEDQVVAEEKPVQYASPLVYSISEWPDFDVLEPSSCLMSLCGSIMNNPTRFHELEKRHFYGSEEKLRSMLNDLNRAGYLKVTMMDNVEKVHSPESNVQKGHFNTWQKQPAQPKSNRTQLNARFA